MDVLGEDFLFVVQFKSTVLVFIVIPLVAIVVACTRTLAKAQRARCVLIGTIDKPDVAATEHVAVALGNTCLGTYLAAVDVHVSLAEDIAVGVERACAAKVVDTLSTTEHVAHDVAAIHINMCLAGSVDDHIGTLYIMLAALVNGSATNGRNLATAEDAVAHIAAVECDTSGIHIAVVDVTAAKDVTAIQQVGVRNEIAFFVLPGLVDNLLLVAVVQLGLRVVAEGRIIFIADVTIAQRDVGGAEHGSTLTTGVGVALDSRNAVGEAVAVGLADDDIRRARNIGCAHNLADGGIHLVAIYRLYVFAHDAFPATAIDVAAGTTLDVGRGTGRKGFCIIIVQHGTTGACGIDVLHDGAAKQFDAGGSADIGIGTKAAAVGVVPHGSTFIDVHVGVVSVAVQSGRLNQGAVQAVVQMKFFGVFIRISNVFIFIARQTEVKCFTFILPPLNQRLQVQHHTVVTAAIDLIDAGTRKQVDLGVLRPGVFTITATEDCGLIAGAVRTHGTGIDRHVDVDLSVEGAVGRVVAAEDFLYASIRAVVVHMCLIDIARDKGVITVGTAEDALQLDGGASRHVNHRAACNTLLKTAAKHILHLAAHQVDDGRGFVEVEISSFGCSLVINHAKATIGTGTENLHVRIVLHVGIFHLWNIDEHIAAVLHQVSLWLVFNALTGTIDLLHHVVLVGVRGAEVDKSVVQEGFGIARAGLAKVSGIGSFIINNIFVFIFRSRIEEVLVLMVCIVISSVAATEDTCGTALQILHVGRSRQHVGGGGGVGIVMHLLYNLAAHTSYEIFRTFDFSAQVVGTIHDVAHPGETLFVGSIFINVGTESILVAILHLTTNIRLGMSEDVGIT